MNVMTPVDDPPPLSFPVKLAMLLTVAVFVFNVTTCYKAVFNELKFHKAPADKGIKGD